MNRLEKALRQLRDTLEAIGYRCALVGGLAVSTRAEPRFTRDVDVAVAVRDDDDAEVLTAELMSRGWQVLARVEQSATGRLATVRLAPPDGQGVVTDLLFASSGVEVDIVDGAELIEVISGVELPVARRSHLLALKVLSNDERRPQDAADIASLLAQADRTDIAECGSLLDIITQRGFDRERDLRRQLDIVLRRFRPDLLDS